MRSTRQMEDFKKVIQECGLQEVSFTRPKFTWSRGKGSNMILERLDRELACENWLHLFPMLYEKHLTTTYSDHLPLLFHVSNRLCRRKMLKDLFVLRTYGWDSDCETIVKDGWKRKIISNFEGLSNGVAYYGKLLSKWNREVFGNINHRIKFKKMELGKLFTDRLFWRRCHWYM